METIEKITVGLANCLEACAYVDCTICPYFESEECRGRLMRDAREEIVELEADRKELEEENRKLKRRIRRLKKGKSPTVWSCPNGRRRNERERN